MIQEQGGESGFTVGQEAICAPGDFECYLENAYQGANVAPATAGAVAQSMTKEKSLFVSEPGI